MNSVNSEHLFRRINYTGRYQDSSYTNTYIDKIARRLSVGTVFEIPQAVLRADRVIE